MFCNASPGAVRDLRKSNPSLPGKRRARVRLRSHEDVSVP